MTVYLIMEEDLSTNTTEVVGVIGNKKEAEKICDGLNRHAPNDSLVYYKAFGWNVGELIV